LLFTGKFFRVSALVIILAFCLPISPTYDWVFLGPSRRPLLSYCLPPYLGKRSKKMWVTIFPNSYNLFLKFSIHKKILVILTSPRILMPGCSQDWFLKEKCLNVCTFHSNGSICWCTKYVLRHVLIIYKYDSLASTIKHSSYQE
jgi:hypothetical protein